MNSSRLNLTVEGFDVDTREFVKRIVDWSTVFVVVIIMIAMGADVYPNQIWNHIRRPVGIAVGMLCQFVVMPLLGFTATKILNLKDAYAFGILLITCCPGGAISSIFTYYMDGDIPLSITMTSISTLLALGCMPLNLWIYGHFVKLDGLEIPYMQMATSLALIMVPALAGILLRWTCPKIACYATKIGGIVTFLVIVVSCTLMNTIVYPGVFLSFNWALVVAVTMIPFIGFLIGYWLSGMANQDLPVRKTIAIESGIQNVAVAFAIITLSSFPFETQGLLMMLPVLYGVCMITMCTFFSVFYMIWKKVSPKLEKDSAVY